MFSKDFISSVSRIKSSGSPLYSNFKNLYTNLDFTIWMITEKDIQLLDERVKDTFDLGRKNNCCKNGFNRS